MNYLVLNYERERVIYVLLVLNFIKFFKTLFLSSVFLYLKIEK